MRHTAIALLLLCASSAYAQIENCDYFKVRVDAMAAGKPVMLGTQPSPEEPALSILNIGGGARCFLIYAATAGRGNDHVAFIDLVKKFESSRTDKQSSAGAAASGSTSVVAQGPAAKVLSVAAEYGAVTQDVNGQVITLRGSPAGLMSALVKHDIFPYCVGEDRSNGYCVRGSLLSLLRRLTGSVSFDASRDHQVTATSLASAASNASTQPVAFNASRSEIAAVSARIEIVNGRDATSEGFKKAWAERVGAAMSDTGAALLREAGDAFDVATDAAEYKAWLAKHLARMRAAATTHDRARIVAALHDALQESFEITTRADKNFTAHAEAALAAYNRFFLAQDEFIELLAKKNVVAFEWANDRPIGEPSTTTFRLIADLPLSPQTKLVANGGVTIYDDRAALASTGAARLRDVQAAAQLDQALGKFSITGPLVFSLAAYYQYQYSPAILSVDPTNPAPGVSFVGLPAGTKTVFANTGNIILGQAKLTLTPPGSGVKIPASVTFSNRTELIDKPTWKAQVGVTYDFDSLFAGLK
jgi:hypothetical protein